MRHAILLTILALSWLWLPADQTLRAERGEPDTTATSSVQILVTLNKQVFREGEEATVTVRASEPVYLHLFSVAEDGSVTVLLPNPMAPRNHLLAGQEFTFPTESQRELGLRLQVALPKGATRAIESIKVIATREKMDLAHKEQALNDVFRRYTGRGEGQFQHALKQVTGLESPDWTEATLAYEISK